MNMAEKKYFWLKLPKDFFTQPKIKKLRSIAGGDTYTIIYLKMQLISLEFGGFIPYEGIEETFVEEIALRIDEKVENVEVTINYLFSQGLLGKIEENVYKLPETVELIGSESASAARVRKCRERKKVLLKASEEKKKYGEYQHVELSDSDVKSLTEKGIDLDKWIQRLDEYIESTGKAYKNHALKIRQWSEKEKKEEQKQLPEWYGEVPEEKVSDEALKKALELQKKLKEEQK